MDQDYTLPLVWIQVLPLGFPTFFVMFLIIFHLGLLDSSPPIAIMKWYRVR
jgi:hypothetical protein